MKILVCNDDGIHAAGLKALCQVLTEKGHEVVVVAPDKERSAMGHALTLHQPLRVESMPIGFLPGVQAAYSIDGTPADCVKIALNKILKFSPDWVISGINHGPNLGADVLYSGTVSAAMEGAIYNIKSMALSISEYTSEHFSKPASFVPQILELLNNLNFTWPPKTIFNVNLPIHEINGAALTNLGSRMYKDLYEERIDPRDRVYYWLSGDLLTADPDPNSDVSKLAENLISITPITFEMTNQQVIQELKPDFNNLWQKYTS